MTFRTTILFVKDYNSEEIDFLHKSYFICFTNSIIIAYSTVYCKFFDV